MRYFDSFGLVLVGLWQAFARVAAECYGRAAVL
jgi:hypothetical protein